MDSTDENQLASRLRLNLQQNGFDEHLDSPYGMLFSRDSSALPDVKKTYFIFTRLEECASGPDLQINVKAAKDYLASLSKSKGEHYVLYFVGLVKEVPQELADFLYRHANLELRREIVPVLIEPLTNRWFIAGESYVSLPYDSYKFLVQEFVDLVGSVLYPDFLALPRMEEILLDICLAPDAERREIIKTKYKESRAVLFSICNLQAMRGEDIGPSFDVRHALAVNYLKQALIDEISPARGSSGFDIGYSAGSKEILYRQLQDQRIGWFKAGAISALAYCRDCKQIVEPVPVKQGVMASNQRVGCPHSEKHKRLVDLVFFMPDELEKFTGSLMKKHS